MGRCCSIFVLCTFYMYMFINICIENMINLEFIYLYVKQIDTLKHEIVQNF